jgi:hypothetical protein
MTTDDLTSRAVRAYFRSGGIDQPSNASGEVVSNGKRYVVLHNIRGVLAVYRVSNAGALRRLNAWPDDLSVR